MLSKLFGKPAKKRQVFQYALDLREFKTLVKGGELIILDRDKRINARIILCDIGFSMMRASIRDAEEKMDYYKSLTVEVKGGTKIYPD